MIVYRDLFFFERESPVTGEWSVTGWNWPSPAGGKARLSSQGPPPLTGTASPLHRAHLPSQGPPLLTGTTFPHRARLPSSQGPPPFTGTALSPRAPTPKALIDVLVSQCPTSFKKVFLLQVLGRIQALGRMKWEGWERETKLPCTGRRCDLPPPGPTWGHTGRRGLGNQMSPRGRNL